jgi:zinc transport system substrate-binding protein
VSGLKDGAIWFQIGEPFEQKLGPLLKETAKVDLRRGVSMIDNESHHCHACGQDHLDRHIWLSPKQAALQADHITKVLSARYPEQAEEFKTRNGVLKEELLALNDEIEAILKNAHAKTFLVSHPAFAYFCRDYDLKQLSVEQEGKDPRPKELEAVYRSAIETQAEVAIALPQHNNKGAQLIAERLRIPVRVIDPYSAEYFETMRTLAGLIANPYQTNE